MSQTTYKIIVADDHPLFRTALCEAMKEALGKVEILQSGSISNLEGTTAAHRDCDLLLLDLQMPGANGFSGLILMRREYPEIPVAIISAREDSETIRKAIEFGASGFIPKSSDLGTLGIAVQAILNGNIWTPRHYSEQAPLNGSSREEKEFSERIKTLTPQQLKVYMMLTRGLLNKQIAAEIHVSEATIRTHMTAIFRKLGVRNRTQAVLVASHLSLDNEPAID